MSRRENPFPPDSDALRDRDRENHLIAFLPLVRSWARRLCGGDEAFREDLIQEGLVAILKGLDAFSPERGPLPPFLGACVRNRLLSALRRYRRERRVLLFGEIPPEVERNVSEDAPGTWEWEGDLERLRTHLSEKEAVVLAAYLEGGSVAKATGLLRWSRKEVDNALQRVRRKARLLESPPVSPGRLERDGRNG